MATAGRRALAGLLRSVSSVQRCRTELRPSPFLLHCRGLCAGETRSHPSLVFRQLFDQTSFTYTYVLGDRESGECVLIDPVMEMVDRDTRVISELGLRLTYALNTHVHADHVTGTGELKKRSAVKSVIAKVSNAVADVQVDEGDTVKFGQFELEVRSTPGHTDGCLTFVLKNQGKAFTGDALLIRGCGRTDFQQGDPGRLYDSVHGKILALPDDTQLYPAHDYTGQTVTTVAEEKKFNPRLSKPKAEFVQLMNELKLPYPRLIDMAVPANMVCGLQELMK